ncbi:ATP-binding protein [Peribacillus castrilensis]|uniref:ATP-binding protein n=1 Tax=Bacillaceae TaxID=186817 RepID=UPI00065FA2A5|nr:MULTISPECIES: ATP-binding protein [Bacillaceae]MCF7621992.1 ATP-binding protein [Peribacillus frigoritolerans]MCP1156123.1 ATP-binding protein [Peribacillus frigoritolerans]MCT1390711.1 ATP-binding protein [Peribacillus frigoritolerans]PRA86356.1 ATP-binding protein [Peribacillus simplex]
MNNNIGSVISSSPDLILIGINSLKNLEDNKDKLQIGQYLKVSDGNSNFIICVINNIRALDYNIQDDLKLIIESQPIGSLVEDKFLRGTKSLPVPTEPVFILNDGLMDRIFKANGDYNFPMGVLSQNQAIEVKIDGDKFFGKHVAIVGSTGSGKSCTVARIIQNAVGINDAKNLNIGERKNSHILIFDIHSEYKSAFTLDEEQEFTLNNLSVDKLKLPYWLMNSQELESLFIESNENNSHNQISMFKQAVILNKEKHNPSVNEITYDTPVYFSIKEVFNYIENMNREVIGKLAGENCPKLLNGTLINDRKEHYFDTLLEFVPQSTAAATKASNGPFCGEFNRFTSRFETTISDKRLKFILDPHKEDGSIYSTHDFEEIMQQFLGYLNRSNITIVDLSGIPFEVLSITVSLVSRLVFDFCFYYSKMQHDDDLLNDIPVMIVCEEAHNYIPRTGGAEYNSSKKSIERIAKEGRKYGLSLMVVSQRPAEVSETIFAQCNNFVSLRLTNSNDQNFIKNLLPDSTKNITQILPSLSSGECIVVGDSIIMPTIIKLDKPNPEPKSQSVKFFNEWQKPWKEISFVEILRRWRKEEGIE